MAIFDGLYQYIYIYSNINLLPPSTLHLPTTPSLLDNYYFIFLGNASTTRNHNSSRFGKYIQLQFSHGNHVVGASIQTYLLEKTRVVYQCDGARNFHIFYQMLFGGNEREMRNWLLPNVLSSDNLNYVKLNRSEDACNQKDKQDFIITKQAMCNVGLSRSQQQELFKVLSGILHLGNVEFISDDDVTGPCEIDSEKQGVDTTYVNAAAQLLGLDVDALTRCLAFRQITASHKHRKSVFMKPCLKDECHTRRDCLAKLLYASICLFTDLLYIQNKPTEDVVHIQ
ncbi:unconventional myosin-XIX-like [Antedon mediterranea]|uniref:unconventional myosin-XIX-like n=1 Tax=Antedon mediterranea TaxID=105859 RepID=UPI003AF83B61